MTSFATFQSNDTTPAVPAQPQGLLSKVGSFVGGAANDAYNTLIATPAIRTGQAVADVGLTGYNKLTGGSLDKYAKGGNLSTALSSAESQPVTTPLTGTTVAPQKTGLAGAEQIGGQALKSAAYLAPAYMGAGDVVGAGAGKGLLSRVGQGALQGAKIGAVSGGLGGAGQSMSQGGNVSDVLGSAGTGAATGAVAGGVIGGATGAISNIWEKAYSNQSSGYQAGVDQATANANTAGTNAVSAVNQINQTAQSDLSQMGQEFKAGAQQIETANPGATMDIPKDVADQLKTIKENAKFALPDFVANKDWTLATPTQTQELITQLNHATFQAKASGEFAVNQQLIDLTNQIKDSAAHAFGSLPTPGATWSDVYSNYSAGRAVLDKLDGIVNLDPNASPADLNKQLTGIQKLGSTPQGQQLVQNAIDEWQKVRGVDATNPVSVINYVTKSQQALATAETGGHGHQLMEALKSPRLEARHIMTAVISVLGIGLVFSSVGKSLFKSVTGALTGQ